MSNKTSGEQIYLVPATSFHLSSDPENSYLVYDNHRKMLKELFENSKKYYCAEDIKQDLMALEAPILPCSTYDETARIAFAMLQQCDTLEDFQKFIEKALGNPDAMMPGSLIVPTFPKSEVGRSICQPATELTRGCFAVCAIAVAALVCMAASCVLGYNARDLKSQPFPDYRIKVKYRDSIKNFRVKE